MTSAASPSVRVGIVGVGNCASALVQGLTHYRDAHENEPVPGLMHPDLGGYRVRDVEISAAFDVNAHKVGRDVAEAIFASPNNTIRFATPAPLGVTVARGRTLDGIGRWLTEDVPESPEPEADIGRILRETRTDVLVSYLPVGSQKATEYYAEHALDAGCAFVNCIPVFIASDEAWRRRFAARGVPLIGDDIKSQVGATIVHRVLANLFGERGVRLARTYQLNFGGNSDFKTMLERERLDSKKISKTRAVSSQLDMPLAPGDIHIGPSDHVPWLEDRKWAHIRMEGMGFGGAPLNLELKLEVWDSPNSAGVVIDAVRCARLALDRGIGGALEGPSSWFMKSPPVQFTDHEAHARLERFIAGEA
ncbi:inositol-3-phosphate synthase [Rhodoplanes sp. TEM]|uniref:Inositol-3-phosphate synthase n=1 Tax=Rhodoplanes tepidamans TaxID=200616 RepID=A0ABT5J855_RHOTP|nr:MULTISPECIES: inositol-3-phosphate synthase [Rhodoplanes]MDC7785479.1 inositol-3-phosphate synthase [Rhodoplanes tepidamans]MDC7987326.1 inositol-3-phosphate synthase [Rhodoplanes sp. TEM]MDQ0353351.1 myo-inositol-1-phosphate synthase [Rhodoplanes tepidamans]